MSDFEPLKRNSYVSERLLAQQDLKIEQNYFLEKLKRHNRFLHGFGVVEGLKLNRKGILIKVEPGVALDCAGNEIVVSDIVQADLPPGLPASATVYLCLRYTEKPTGTNIPNDGSEARALVTEAFEIVILSDNPHRNHRHQKARWLACGRPHELALARLQCKSGAWRIVRSYRPPMVK